MISIQKTEYYKRQPLMYRWGEGSKHYLRHKARNRIVSALVLTAHQRFNAEQHYQFSPCII
jgi:hypothetical protein